MKPAQEPYMGIGKYLTARNFTEKQRMYWNALPMKTRIAIRNGTAPGMTGRQLGSYQGHVSWYY